MAEPTYYQLGVAIPVANQHMRHGRQFSTTLAANYAAGTETILVTTTSPTTSYPYLNKLVQAGDKLTLGPSSDMDNENASEEVTIASISARDDSNRHSVVLTDGLAFDFSLGDRVTGISSLVPESWVIQTDAYITGAIGACYLNRLFSFPEDNFSGSLKTLDDGIDDYECFKIRLDHNHHSIRGLHVFHNIDDDCIIGNTYYRMGCFYRIKWLSGDSNAYMFMLANDVDTDQMRINSGSSISLQTIVTKANSPSGEIIRWTEFLSSAFNVTSISNNYLRLGVGVGSTSVSNVDADALIYLDNPYLEHAKGTSADTSTLPVGQVNRGVYTFTEMPVLGSVDFSFRTFETDIELSDGTIKTVNPAGRRAKRWEFTCNFENADISFLRDLDILMAHQMEGRRLIFHTKEAIGASTSRVPPIMVGKMYVDRVRQNIWDRGKVSFTFQFKETY